MYFFIIYRVELAVWTHYNANELKTELLDGMPVFNNHITSDTTTTESETNDDTIPDTTITTTTNGVPTSIEASDESNLEPAAPPATTNGNNGKCKEFFLNNFHYFLHFFFIKIGAIDSLDESSTRSEDSCEKAITPIGVISDEATNDSDSQNSIKR